MSLVTYEVVCPRCGHLRIFPTETEFEIMVGATVKQQIDHQSQQQKVSSSSSSSVARIRCQNCSNDFAVNSANVEKKIHHSSKTNNNNLSAIDDESAEAQVKNVLNEEIKSYIELDPLMLALEKSKKTNVAVDLEDLAELMGKYRWLIAPVHSFLRVFVFKNIAEHHIIGNVSFYLTPRATAGKSPSSLSFFARLYTRLFPLAFSPDMPLALLPMAGTAFAVVTNILCLHFFLRFDKVTNGDLLHEIQHLTILVVLLAFLSMYLMIRTIIREPGYLIPKNKEMYFENENDSVLSSSYVSSLMNSNNNNNSINVTTTSNNNQCSMCQIVNRPPRASHCKSNHLCICEKDHHCVVIGAAIGRRNVLFFALFLMAAFFASLVDICQLCWFVYEYYNLISTLGWLSLVANLAVAANFLHFTQKWSFVIWGGVLKGLNTSEQNKLFDSENNNTSASESSTPIVVTAVPGTPWSRFVNFITRPNPPSVYCTSLENINNKNENHNHQDDGHDV